MDLFDDFYGTSDTTPTPISAPVPPPPTMTATTTTSPAATTVHTGEKDVMLPTTYSKNSSMLSQVVTKSKYVFPWKLYIIGMVVVAIIGLYVYRNISKSGIFAANDGPSETAATDEESSEESKSKSKSKSSKSKSNFKEGVDAVRYMNMEKDVESLKNIIRTQTGNLRNFQACLERQAQLMCQMNEDNDRQEVANREEKKEFFSQIIDIVRSNNSVDDDDLSNDDDDDYTSVD